MESALASRRVSKGGVRSRKRAPFAKVLIMASIVVVADCGSRPGTAEPGHGLGGQPGPHAKLDGQAGARGRRGGERHGKNRGEPAVGTNLFGEPVPALQRPDPDCVAGSVVSGAGAGDHGPDYAGGAAGQPARESAMPAFRYSRGERSPTRFARRTRARTQLGKRRTTPTTT